MCDKHATVCVHWKNVYPWKQLMILSFGVKTRNISSIYTLASVIFTKLELLDTNLFLVRKYCGELN